MNTEILNYYWLNVNVHMHRFIIERFYVHTNYKIFATRDWVHNITMQ